MNKHPYPQQVEKLNLSIVHSLVEMALLEDDYLSDITTNAIFSSADAICQGIIIAKNDLVLAGSEFIKEVFQFIDANSKITFFAKDGDFVTSGERVAIVDTKISVLLQGERVMLNFLSFTSAIATHTRKVQELLIPHGIKVVDTRKTLPTLRHISKYAVHIGGGVNHRLSLSKMGLIKDNHIVFAKNIIRSIELFRKVDQKIPLEIEVDTQEQLVHVLEKNHNVQLILLDNMSVDNICTCVSMIKDYDKKYSKRTYIECSGGYSIKNIEFLKNTKIDYVSMGALTHTIYHVDFSLDIVNI